MSAGPSSPRRTQVTSTNNGSPARPSAMRPPESPARANGHRETRGEVSTKQGQDGGSASRGLGGSSSSQNAGDRTTRDNAGGSQAKSGREPALSEAPPKVLRGDNICFAEKHFSNSVKELLTTIAENLGAQITSRTDCNVLLLNPASTTYTKTMEELKHLQQHYPDARKHSNLPYHWLLTCLSRRERLPLETSSLITPKPFIVHPSQSTDHSPLKVYVSVNVQKTPDEDSPYRAQSNVSSELMERGAVIVEKRSMADILVVDRRTNFFANVVLKEREKYGRAWQRIVEREWVDDCVRNGRMVWPPMEEEGDEVDSMAEEDEPLRNGKGPGRPTGKPRVDYTPADDDFLCRYLAAFHPGGSWHSRKTYGIMVSRQGLFPPVERHSAQSWHERFKKSSTQFEKRVRRFIDEGIDNTLKTSRERAEAQKRKQNDEDDWKKREQAGQASVKQEPITSDRPEAQPLNRTHIPKSAAQQTIQGSQHEAHLHRTVAEREGARLTAMAAEAVAEAQGQANAQAATVHVDVASSKEGEVAVNPGPDQWKSKRKRLIDLDDEDVAPEGDVATGVATAVSQQGGAISSDLELQPATTLETPQLAQVSSVTEPAAGNTSIVDGVDDTEMRPANAALKTDGGDIPVPLENAPTTTLHAVQPEAGPSVRHDAVSAGEPHTSSAIRRQRRPRSSLPKLEDFARSPHTPVNGITPRLSLLEQGIRSSEAKRRRTLERAIRGRSSDRASSPDKVYVLTNLTNQQYPSLDKSRSNTPTVPPSVTRPPKSPPPILSPMERSVKIHEGQLLAQAVREQYKEHISKYSRKYSIKPSQVYELVHAHTTARTQPSGGGGELYWEDVDRSLKTHFGY